MSNKSNRGTGSESGQPQNDKLTVKGNNNPATKADLANLLKEAEKVDTGDLNLMNSDLIEFKEGEEVNCVFIGFGEMKDRKGDPFKTCKLLFADESEKQNADKVLVSTMEKWQAKNPDLSACVIRIRCEGMKRSDKGQYKDLKVYTF